MTDDNRVSEQVIGSLRRENGRGTVRMEHVLHTDAADVWSALTDPSRLARWLARVSGEFRLGGTLLAEFTSHWSGPLRVDVCDEQRRLVVTADPGSADETVMEAIIQEEGKITRLIVEERGLPVPEYVDHGAGWQVHIEDLDAYLRGRETSNWEARWRQLQEGYVAMLGGEAPSALR